MTTKEITAEKVKLQETKTELMEKYINPISEKLSILEKKRIQSILDNKEYLVDLSEYEGKQIEDITALNSDGSQEYISTDEIVEVKNGRLYCSSYQGGIVEWSATDNCYYESYHHSIKKLNIIGFIGISFETD